jgi:glycosyltransferase involved in cell wall biosynthesis
MLSKIGHQLASAMGPWQLATRMITVTALTEGVTTPSARFRVRQYVAPLRARGILVRELCAPVVPWTMPTNKYLRKPVIMARWGYRLVGRAPALWHSHQTDVTLLSRQFVQGVPTLERALKSPWILDVDDALWLARPFGHSAAKQAARAASVVVAGNQSVADWYRQYTSEVVIVPTSIDTERFVPRESASEERFVVGWMGSKTNLPFLENIERPLFEFLRKHPDAELSVVCDAAPRFSQIPADRVRFTAWSAETEVRCVQEMHVGLMPLADSELARGKSAAKMLTYLACAKPAVVSPVGANADVLSLGDVGWGARDDDQWLQALEHCYADRGAAHEKGRRGRTLVEREYSVHTSVEKLGTLIARLTGATLLAQSALR